MAKTSTYLNFNGSTEEAFIFYKGDYFASFADKFGVQWMVNCSSKV